MQHSDFKIGMIFWSSLRAAQAYKVTDIGSRVIVAALHVEGFNADSRWLEFVFNEGELACCTLTEPDAAPADTVEIKPIFPADTPEFHIVGEVHETQIDMF
jgi:hypothetical protein